MRKVWAVMAAAIAVGVMASPAAADDKKLSGSFTLQDGAFGKKGEPCSGNEGYDDIQAGAQVRIRNGNNKTLGVGSLGTGRNVPTGVAGFMYCKFPFSVKVSDGEDFYSIEVSHRGEITYPKKKLEKLHWRVALSLG